MQQRPVEEQGSGEHAVITCTAFVAQPDRLDGMPAQSLHETQLLQHLRAGHLASHVAGLDGIQGEPFRHAAPHFLQGRRLVYDIDADEPAAHGYDDPVGVRRIRKLLLHLLHLPPVRLDHRRKVFRGRVHAQGAVLASDFAPQGNLMGAESASAAGGGTLQEASQGRGQCDPELDCCESDRQRPFSTHETGMRV